MDWEVCDVGVAGQEVKSCKWEGSRKWLTFRDQVLLAEMEWLCLGAINLPSMEVDCGWRKDASELLTIKRLPSQDFCS